MSDSNISLTDDEMDRLRKATTGREWGDVCDDIKSARDGQYPHDWFRKVLASGLLHELQQKWVEP
jgi:hypothetical protein